MEQKISNNPIAEPEDSGARLAHILDQIGFKAGRGRIGDFHQFLKEKRPQIFGDLKYTTVRSWFHDSAPPMKKVQVIVDALQEVYVIPYDLSQVKTWWKVGGFYPFTGKKSELDTRHHNSNAQPISDQKLQFIVMSLVTEETGDDFNQLSGEQLVEIKEKAIQLAKDFSDPFLTDCPREYLLMAIRDATRKVKLDKS